MTRPTSAGNPGTPGLARRKQGKRRQLRHPAQDGDIAYLARHQADGRIVVHIAGVHAIGSLGAAHYLTGHLAELSARAGEESFSAVIRCTFDGLAITGSELAAGPYAW